MLRLIRNQVLFYSLTSRDLIAEENEYSKYDAETQSLYLPNVEVSGLGSYSAVMNLIETTPDLIFELRSAEKHSLDLVDIDYFSFNTGRLVIPEVDVSHQKFSAILNLINGSNPIKFKVTNASLPPKIQVLEVTNSDITPYIFNIEGTHEAIIPVLDNGKIKEITYIDDSENILKLHLKDNGLPDYIDMEDIIVRYSNYRDGVVDLTIEAQSSSEITTVLFNIDEYLSNYNLSQKSPRSTAGASAEKILQGVGVGLSVGACTATIISAIVSAGWATPLTILACTVSSAVTISAVKNPNLAEKFNNQYGLISGSIECPIQAATGQYQAIITCSALVTSIVNEAVITKNVTIDIEAKDNGCNGLFPPRGEHIYECRPQKNGYIQVFQFTKGSEGFDAYKFIRNGAVGEYFNFNCGVTQFECLFSYSNSERVENEYHFWEQYVEIGHESLIRFTRIIDTDSSPAELNYLLYPLGALEFNGSDGYTILDHSSRNYAGKTIYNIYVGERDSGKLQSFSFDWSEHFDSNVGWCLQAGVSKFYGPLDDHSCAEMVRAKFGRVVDNYQGYTIPSWQ